MNKKGLLLVLTTAFISGFSIFLNKFGVSISNPYVYAFAKNFVVALMLGSLVLAWKNYSVLLKLSKKQWLNLVIIGLIGGGIPFLLFFKGLSLTSAAESGFIHKSMFVFTAMLAVVFLKEKINFAFIFGALLVFLGNFLSLQSLNFSLGRGDMLVFLAVLFWSAENILSKYMLKKLDGKTVAWGRMFFGSIFILIFLVFTNQISPLFSFNLKQFAWIGLTSALLFVYVITWYSGLKLLPAAVAASILVLGSPVTTFLSAVSAGKIASADLYSSLLVTGGLLSIIGSDYLWHKIANLKNGYVRS